jgi:hypothetical protein
MNKNELLDNDGLGLDTTFGKYIKESYGINDFIFYVFLILSTFSIMVFSMYLNFRLWLFLIYIAILYINIVEFFNRYLNWSIEEIRKYSEKNKTKPEK